MQLMWGDDIAQETKGLDILGVRGLDQNLEAALVNGITTISIRARYLTVLPWAIGEFFAGEQASGTISYDAKRFQNYLGRVEYLVLAATMTDPSEGDMSGVLGSLTFREEMNALRAGREIQFPLDRSGAMLGTYLGPCRALGIFADAPSGTPFPIILTPRGQQIWRARNAMISDSEGLAAIIGSSERLSRDVAERLAPAFSLKQLNRNTEEASLLRTALTLDWANGAKSSGAYERFNRTLDLLRKYGKAASLQAEGILVDKYREAVDDGSSDGTLLAWAEYEWRARLHFALETLFSAICQTLSELGEASVGEIIKEWQSALELPDVLLSTWGGAAAAWSATVGKARSSVPARLFLGENLPISDIVRLSPHARALFSFAILTSLAAQTEALRNDGRFADRHAVGDAALRAISSADLEPFEVTMVKLARLCVDAHLKTTYRKMAGGQKCSLRFFENGSRLVPTGIAAEAGRSGIRLHNVIGILAEAGIEGIQRAA